MAIKARAADSILIVVDEQPSFMQAIWEAERVLRRTDFLLRIAALVGVPVLATEQYPRRMGGTNPLLMPFLLEAPFGKMSFSCCGCEAFMARLEETGRRQAILVGIETHICVSQTAADLLNSGFEVVVCPDAVSARTVEMHKLGMERMRDSGALPMHSESVAYEWMGTAEHPAFREALKVVKELAGS
ncbi:MAG TPA: isochorismatase family protein [Fimbriimonadaceae bacterium]|nr:isochorismatase family protein [Fimbriimonadaceae bacterium]